MNNKQQYLNELTLRLNYKTDEDKLIDVSLCIIEKCYQYFLKASDFKF